MLYIKSMIHYELIFVKVIRAVSRFFSFLFLVWGRPVIPAPFFENTSSPLHSLCFFVNNQLTMFVWVFFRVLYSLPLIYLSMLLPIPRCLDYSSFIKSLEVG